MTKTTTLTNADGFSLAELLITVGIIGVVMVTAIAVVPNMMAAARADGGSAIVVNTFRLARDRAIGERRNMSVVFVGLNRIQINREEIGSPTPPPTTVIDVFLANGQQFQMFTATGDTLDLFGLTNSPLAFGAGTTTAAIMFTSEGTLVDSGGEPINGTVFLGTPSDIASARAVTIFGPTALVRSWRWDGMKWAE
jgi:prepilin-type N-terminal cleavage/methylation domain-containing protein